MAPNQRQPTYDQSPLPPTSDRDGSTAFPILAIAVISIMGTAFLLLSYYIFVSKCWSSNWHHQLNLLRRISSLFRSRLIQDEEDTFIALSPTMWNRGLHESVIREIPTFQFKTRGGDDADDDQNVGTSVYGCVVCLNEFQEHDMLRLLPNCSHGFHLDCIDIWLQSNANCPLCRTSISGCTNRYPFNQIIAPSSSPQDSLPFSTDRSLMGGDEDFVVIELGGDERLGQQERDNQSRSEEAISLMELEQQQQKKKKPGNLKARKPHHLSIMGDECIDVRHHLKDHDKLLSVQPIRRSFSLDSAVDRQLFLSVQAIVQQNRCPDEVNTSEEECSNGGARKSLFPFGRNYVRPRNAVLPVEFDL